LLETSFRTAYYI